jgi:hypothetical protein
MAWKQWLGDNPLSPDQMTVAVSYWQQVFEDTAMHKVTHDRIMQFRAENKRESKESARKLSRVAFRAFLQKTYGVPQLAKAFVKYPAVALHSLVQSWTEYKQSTEYLSQKQRSAHTRSPEYRQDEERWAKTATVHRLRYSRRQATRHEDRPSTGQSNGNGDSVSHALAGVLPQWGVGH